MALAAIGTPDAWDTIRWIDLYWGAARKDKLMDEFVHKTLAQRDGGPKSGEGSPVFVEHRRALFQRRGDAGYRTSVYCPSCRGPMTSLKGTVPYQCRKCEVKVDFSARDVQAVMAELR
jgi:hypothetical protein